MSRCSGKVIRLLVCSPTCLTLLPTWLTLLLMDLPRLGSWKGGEIKWQMLFVMPSRSLKPFQRMGSKCWLFQTVPFISSQCTRPILVTSLSSCPLWCPSSLEQMRVQLAAFQGIYLALVEWTHACSAIVGDTDEPTLNLLQASAKH